MLRILSYSLKRRKDRPLTIYGRVYLIDESTGKRSKREHALRATTTREAKKAKSQLAELEVPTEFQSLNLLHCTQELKEQEMEGSKDEQVKLRSDNDLQEATWQGFELARLIGYNLACGKTDLPKTSHKKSRRPYRPYEPKRRY